MHSLLSTWTLGKLFNLSEPYFSHLQNGEKDSIYLRV